MSNTNNKKVAKISSKVPAKKTVKMACKGKVEAKAVKLPAKKHVETPISSCKKVEAKVVKLHVVPEHPAPETCPSYVIEEPLTGKILKEVKDAKPEVKPEVKAEVKAEVKDTKKKITPKAAPISIVSFDKALLVDALKVSTSFVDRKVTMPILSCVNIKIDGSKADLLASDLECTFHKKLVCESSSPINICIPAKTLYDEVNALPDGTEKASLHFYAKDEEHGVSYVVLNSRAQMFTMSGDEFPSLPVFKDKKTAEIKNLIDHLKSVIPAAGEGDTRYTMNGIYFDLAEGHIVGTDGHRLHFTDTEKSKEAKPFICPAKAVSLAIKFKAADKFVVGESLSCFSIAGGLMFARHIEGSYPQYQNIIPKKHPIKVEFNTGEFLEILEGAMPLSNENKTVKVNYSAKQMEVVSSNANLGHYKWVCPMTMTGTENITLAFNSQYILDALRSFPTEKTSLAIGDTLSPILINGKAVVMPMRQ